MNRLSQGKQELLVACLVEGNSIRGTARLVGVTLNTVLRNLVWIGEACQGFHDKTVKGLQCAEVQADEAWNFIYAKEKNRAELKRPPPEAGDCWTWISKDSKSRLIINWHVGGHEASDAQEFCEDLACRVVGTFQLTTDQLRHYLTAVQDAFGPRVNYATIRKFLDEPDKAPDGKLQPQVYRGDRRAAVYGEPDPELVTTTSIESQNTHLRMSNRRYMRSMNGFSRKLINQRASIALHFTHYNFCRIHPKIRVTPAVEAGLTDHCWDIEELLSTIFPPSVGNLDS